MGAYKKFDASKPDTDVTDGAATIQGLIENMEALLDAANVGMAVDWDGAVTTPGAQPDVFIATDQADTTQKERVSITWGSSGGSANKPTVITFERSYDSGSTWSTAKTMTITWNASGHYVSHVWS